MQKGVKGDLMVGAGSMLLGKLGFGVKNVLRCSAENIERLAKERKEMKCRDRGVEVEVEMLAKGNIKSFGKTLGRIKEKKGFEESSELVGFGIRILQDFCLSSKILTAQIFFEKNFYHIEKIYSRHP